MKRCSKIQHLDVKMAIMAAKRVKKRTGVGLVPYKCKWCGGYHLVKKRYKQHVG